MRPESPALLWDARRAAGFIQGFVAGHVLADYISDVLLKSAVERQFEIIGEALSRLRRVDPEVAETVPDLRRIVAFRNLLVHGYAVIDDAIVWEVASSRLETLAEALDHLLEGIEAPRTPGAIATRHNGRPPEGQ